MISPARAQSAPGLTDITVHELAAGYEWGYWTGVKQPLGAFKNGLNVHQFSKSNYPVQTNAGNPDYLLWVDENTLDFGISIRPTDAFHDNVTHPGGMVSFADDGTIWYTYGGRAVDLPLDLYMSDAPYDLNNFTIRLDNWETYAASTTPCVHVNDPKLLLFWRHGWSSGSNTTVRLRRYDINAGFGSFETEIDIGKGAVHPLLGDVGIEQLYTRYDPRFDLHFVSWQWFDGPYPMGSNPFLYSDDNGDTWRRADGEPITDLPLDYNEIDSVIVPFDHLMTPGEHTEWFPCDIGIAPGGTFWMTTPMGQATNTGWTVRFWRFGGGAWQGEDLTGGMHGQCKPHALGVTKDYLVFVYSEDATRTELKARISADDGATWGEPITIDVLEEPNAIVWVSFVQPADDYVDNTARFFFSYYNTTHSTAGKRYRNNVRWTKFSIVENALPGDVNGDGIVNVEDLLAVLAAWGPCAGCPEDTNGDGVVDVLDLLEVLGSWSL